MKATLKIEIDFDSWFDEDREPKSKKDWAYFFMSNLIVESSIIGADDGEIQDMVSLNSFKVECLEIEQ